LSDVKKAEVSCILPQEALEKEKKQDTKKEIVPQSRYKHEYCELLIAHLKKGLTMDTFGAKVGVVRSNVYEWLKLYKDFNTAYDIGKQFAQEFFEARLTAKISGQNIPGIDTKKIDTACLIFALKTRFHKTYGDRQKIEYSADDATKKAIKLAYDVKE